MNHIVEALLPAVEHYEALESRGGRIFRGKLRDPSPQAKKDLAQTLDAFPGTVFFDEIDGDAYVTYQYYGEQPRVRWLLHAVLLALTVLTTMLAHSEESLDHFYGHMTWVLHHCQMILLSVVGILADGFDASIARLSLMWRHIAYAPAMMTGGVSFSVGVLAILLTHEMGHYFAARRYGMTVTPPYFLPLPFGVGTLGAVIRIRSPMLHRRSLLTVGAAGPIAGFIIAVVVIGAGIALSDFVPVNTVPDDAIRRRLGDSLLTMSMQWLIKGPTPEGFLLEVHPLRLAGWFGLIVTSLNLMPVGQLDGGHIAYSLLGRRQSTLARWALSGLAGLGIYGVISTFGPTWHPWLAALPDAGPMWLICAVFIRSIMRHQHPPLIFEDVPLGGKRTVVAVLMIVMFIVTFIPNPFDLSTLVTAG